MNRGHSGAREVPAKHTVVSKSILYVVPLKLIGKGKEAGKRRGCDLNVIWYAKGRRGHPRIFSQGHSEKCAGRSQHIQKGRNA